MPGRRLFVGNLGSNTQPKELEELFAKVGRLLEVSSNGSYGFVEYANIEDAETAVARLSDIDFKGNLLIVDYARPPRAREDRPPPRGDLHGRTSSHGGSGGGREYGGSSISSSRTYNEDRGTTSYGNPYSNGGPHSRYGGRGMSNSCGPSRSASGRTYGSPNGHSLSGHKLKVSGLVGRTSWQDLKDWARELVGVVGSADVDMQDPSTGYVSFREEDDAIRAVELLSGSDVKGARVIVTKIDGDTAFFAPSRAREACSSRDNDPYSVRGDFGRRDSGYEERSSYGRRGREDYDAPKNQPSAHNHFSNNYSTNNTKSAGSPGEAPASGFGHKVENDDPPRRERGRSHSPGR